MNLTPTDSWLETFRNPSAAFRGKPFWAWNGKLKEAELHRQIACFSEMGFGGFLMHARVGLETAYLSEDWFNTVRSCVNEAVQYGLEPWIYDEDRWPSGFAGGKATESAAHRMWYLRADYLSPAGELPEGPWLASFLGKIEGKSLSALKPAGREEIKQSADSRKGIVFRELQQLPAPRYNNQTYLDTLNPEATAAFFDLTLQAYEKEVLTKLPGRVPGFFTDEPNYGRHQYGPGWDQLPWTPALPEIFRQRYGYDLIPRLPELVLQTDQETWSNVRRDYYDCLCHLFLEAFAKPYGKWCAERNLNFTGHVLGEHPMIGQVDGVGAAMRFYPHMQIPGVDVLTAQGLERPGSDWGPDYACLKQCASVCHQMGRTQMLSELYGCTGWSLTFAEHKAIGDWQAALGVTLRCHHLSWYSMQGEAKRDYPASISFQSSWWRDYALVEDYFARLGVLLNKGRPVRDLAVIHPIESAWGYGGTAHAEGIHALDQKHKNLCNTLLEQHIDFDYVDEALLSEYGSVEAGRLRVGKADYPTVLIPAVVSLRRSTLDLLSAFAAAGGKVWNMSQGSCFVPGEDKPGTFPDSFTPVNPDPHQCCRELVKNSDLRRASIQTASGAEATDVLYQLRVCGDGRWIFFMAYTRQQSGSGPLQVTLPARGAVYEWNANTGETSIHSSKPHQQGLKFQVELPPCGSALFTIDPDIPPSSQPKTQTQTVEEIKLPEIPAGFSMDEPNALVLDKARFQIDGGVWHGEMEILKIDEAVRTHLDLPLRGGPMVQPWARKTVENPPASPLKLIFEFEVEALPEKNVQLVMEQPERFQVYLNGTRLLPNGESWIDPAFHCLPVHPGCWVKGKNRIELATVYGADHGLEALYLIGDFGIYAQKDGYAVGRLPRRLKPGTWTTQGLPFYSGAVSYSYELELAQIPEGSVKLRVSDWKGVLMRIRINGDPAGQIGWPPYELDLHQKLKTGINILTIEIVSSRRNLWGPLHFTDPFPTWTGPGEFRSKEKDWTEGYVLHPYGLMKSPQIIVEKKS